MNSFIARYMAYLKDNPNHYWFKRKAYGWGWVPATWEGWVTLAVFMLLLVGNAFRVQWMFGRTLEAVFIFDVQTFILVALLIGVCYVTGESPRWQWSIPKKSDEQK